MILYIYIYIYIYDKLLLNIQAQTDEAQTSFCVLSPCHSGNKIK